MNARHPNIFRYGSVASCLSLNGAKINPHKLQQFMATAVDIRKETKDGKTTGSMQTHDITLSALKVNSLKKYLLV